MTIRDLNAEEEAELRRLDREFLRDIEAILRRAGITDPDELEVATRQVVDAMMLGICDAAAELHEELKAEFGDKAELGKWSIPIA